MVEWRKEEEKRREGRGREGEEKRVERQEGKEGVVRGSWRGSEGGTSPGGTVLEEDTECDPVWASSVERKGQGWSLHVFRDVTWGPLWRSKVHYKGNSNKLGCTQTGVGRKGNTRDQGIKGVGMGACTKTRESKSISPSGSHTTAPLLFLYLSSPLLPKERNPYHRCWQLFCHSEKSWCEESIWSLPA